MASMSGHKIFGPKGIGLLYKNSKVSLIPIIHGSTRYNNIRPGTPPLPLIVALSKAMRLAINDLDRKEAFVKRLNDKIVHDISHYKDIKINQTKYSIPHILNISLMNIKPESFVHAMEEHEVYISTNTACSSGELSTSVMAIYNDKARATTTIRISLSSITTLDDVNKYGIMSGKFVTSNSFIISDINSARSSGLFNDFSESSVFSLTSLIPT